VSDLRAAVAAGALGSEEGYRELLQSIVEVARAIFGARASSVFLHDEQTDELVFEAVSGEGAGELVGKRFPSSTGVAGWVLVTRQPLVIEELEQDPRFAREAAESTGFVPKGLMAVPLLHEERALGVLEVLDRPQEAAFSLKEMELLGLFANEAAIALDLLQRAREARAVLEEEDGQAAALARLAARLGEAEPEQREVAQRLLEALEAFLASGAGTLDDSL
jgi:GAF domain-containing protein